MDSLREIQRNIIFKVKRFHIWFERAIKIVIFAEKIHNSLADMENKFLFAMPATFIDFRMHTR